MTVPAADALRRQISTVPATTRRRSSSDLAAHGTPLITDDPDDPGCQRVLSLRRPAGHRRRTRGNRPHRRPHLDRGQMRRWGSTGPVVDRTGRHAPRWPPTATYPYAADDPHLRDGVLEYIRVRSPAQWSTIRRTRCGFAVRVGAGHRRRTGPDCVAGAANKLCSPPGKSEGPTREPIRWRLTAPVGRGPGPTRIVVVLDADKWFDEYGLPAAIADAADDTTAPIALLGIDAPTDPTTRLRSAPIASSSPPSSARSSCPARSALEATETTTVWAGQSLGAAAAWQRRAGFRRRRRSVRVLSVDVVEARPHRTAGAMVGRTKLARQRNWRARHRGRCDWPSAATRGCSLIR